MSMKFIPFLMATTFFSVISEVESDTKKSRENSRSGTRFLYETLGSFFFLQHIKNIKFYYFAMHVYRGLGCVSEDERSEDEIY